MVTKNRELVRVLMEKKPLSADAKICTCPDCLERALPPRRFCQCLSCWEWWQAARIVRPKGHK